MKQARGYKTGLIVDFETDYCVAPATKKGLILPFNSTTIGAEQTIINPETITGRRDPVEPARGRVNVTGDATIPMDAVSLGYWMRAIFGAPVTVDNSDGTYTHTFKPNDDQPSLIVQKAFPDLGQYFLYSGVKVGSFKATFGDDGELTADLGLVGGDEEIKTATYDSSPTAVPFKRLNNFSCRLYQNGIETANVTTLDLEWDLGLDEDQYVLGKKCRAGLPEGLFSISGTINAIFNDISVVQQGIDAVESSLELVLSNGTNSLSIKMPECQFARTSPKIDGPAGVTAEFDFSAYFDDSAENTSIIVTLTNDYASYV